MKKYFILLLFGMLLSSCNKDTIEYQILPIQTYPNPFSEVFSISFIPQENLNVSSIKVFDGKDKIVEYDVNNKPLNVYINMKNFSDGVYHVESTINGEKYVQSIIKANK